MNANTNNDNGYTESPLMNSPKSPRKTLLLIEQEEKENLLRADPSKVQVYIESHTIRKKIGDNWIKYPLNSNIEDFSKYGIGITLYLNFLKKISIIFTIMSIISIPSLVSNCIGNGLDDAPNLVKTTLGNQPVARIEFPINVTIDNLQNKDVYNLFLNLNNQIIADYKEKLDNNILMVALPDFFYSLIFFFYIIYMRYEAIQIINKFSKNNVVMQDFALQVTGFPNNITNPENLIQFFENFEGKKYEIIEISLAKDYSNTLHYHKKLAEVQKQIIIEEKRIYYDILRSKNHLNNLKAKRDNLKHSIQQRLLKKNLDKLNHDEYPSIIAYVVFNDVTVAQRILNENRKHWKMDYIQFFKTCKRDMRKIIPLDHQFLGQYPLKIVKAPAPSDILWENLDAKPFEKFLRKLVSAIIIFFLLLITFAVVFATATLGSESNSNCPQNFNEYTDAQKANLPENTVYICFCSQFSSNQILISDSIRNECYDYAVKEIGFQVLSVASSFIIILVNLILKTVLMKLSRFSRHETLTKQTLANVFTVFVSMFFNTAIVTLLISAKFGGNYSDSNSGIVISREIGKIIPPIGDFIEGKKSQYPNDFDRIWYKNVGNKIIITWIINMFYPHLFNLIISPLIIKHRNNKSRKAFIQGDMNYFSVGPDIGLIPKYSSALNTIFVTLFYCSGMPILLFFGAISLIIQFWVEKYLLTNFYARPPFYDHHINSYALRILPISVLLHLSIGIYAYGSENIFMRGIEIFFSDGVPIFQSRIIDFNELFQERIYKVLYLFVLLLIFVLIYMFDISFWRIFSKKMRKRNNLKRIQSDILHTEKTYNNFITELKHQGLTNYQIKGNPNYINLINAINKRSDSMKEDNCNLIEMSPICEEKLK